MSCTKYEVRAGAYYDSVLLMQLQKGLADLPGVIDAGVVMATPANCDLLFSSGYDLDDIDAKAEDLLIVVKASTEAKAEAAIAQVDQLLQRRRSQTSHSFKPRSLKSAVDALPDANWVLVSVPGRYAAGVAEEALNLGKHVFLYSDNVSLDDEIRLKREAREKGLLLMGPDCGTAVINGVGLGFANRLRRGKIGIVAASGTGLQAVSAGIHNLGEGISHAIGTGGRDLKAEVGGITAKQALELLGRDPKTEVIVLISKPPEPSVVTELLALGRTTAKPIVIDFIGYPDPGSQLSNLHFASNLKEAASLAVELVRNTELQSSTSSFTSEDVQTPFLRALFSGGTLAYEALLGLQNILFPVFSNIPIRPEQRLPDSLVSQAHTVLDLGEDEFTQGRLHPMMDNDLRLRRLRMEAGDPQVGMIMLDVVLGEGAHPSPASELAPVIAEVKGQREIDITAIVLGTDEDPQGIDGQVEMLESVGAVVFRETEDAVTYVSERLGPSYKFAYQPLPLSHFEGTFAGINVGLESFYESVIRQGARAIQVDWRPPAGGNEKLMGILAKMRAK
jgi:FdrA protein